VEQNPNNPKILCQPGTDPDLVAVYRALLARWMEGPPVTVPDGTVKNRSQAAFAEMIGMLPQRVTNWKQGTGGHAPPWWVVMWLCDALDAEVRISPSGVAIAWLAPDPTPAEVAG